MATPDPKSLVYPGVSRGRAVIYGEDEPNTTQVLARELQRKRQEERERALQQQKKKSEFAKSLSKQLDGSTKGAWQKDLPQLLKMKQGIQEWAVDQMVKYNLDPTDASSLELNTQYNKMLDALKMGVAQSAEDKAWAIKALETYTKDPYQFGDEAEKTMKEFFEKPLSERTKIDKTKFVPEFEWDLSDEAKSIDVGTEQTGSRPGTVTKGISEEGLKAGIETYLQTPRAQKIIERAYAGDAQAYAEDLEAVKRAAADTSEVTSTRAPQRERQFEAKEREKEEDALKRKELIWRIRNEPKSETGKEAMGLLVGAKAPNGKPILGVDLESSSVWGFGKDDVLVITTAAGTASEPGVEKIRIKLNDPEAKSILNTIMNNATGQRKLSSEDLDKVPEFNPKGGASKEKQPAASQSGGSSGGDYKSQILDFETTKGSGSGKGLSYSQMTGGKAKTKEEAIELLNNEYIPKVYSELGSKSIPSEAEKRLVDYKWNTGRSTTDLLLLANGNISLNDINSKKTFTEEWEKNKKKILAKLSDPNFIEEIDAAKHRVYKSLDPKKYNATWKDRVDMWGGGSGIPDFLKPKK